MGTVVGYYIFAYVSKFVKKNGEQKGLLFQNQSLAGSGNIIKILWKNIIQISCEAVERSKGHSQRTDWRQERKLNSETFGVASARWGGYRGRGYYGNRGMGNVFGRGGYRGYRGGSQNNRGRGNYGGWGSSQQAVSNNATATGNVSK